NQSSLSQSVGPASPRSARTPRRRPCHLPAAPQPSRSRDGLLECRVHPPRWRRFSARRGRSGFGVRSGGTEAGLHSEGTGAHAGGNSRECEGGGRGGGGRGSGEPCAAVVRV